jgi:hypothetical protein
MILPLLRAVSDSGRVQVVGKGLKRLHTAAVTGELASLGYSMSRYNISLSS